MIEVRNNDDGELDEIVARDCSIHLEQMSDGHWWMSIGDGSEVVHVNLTTPGCPVDGPEPAQISASVERFPEVSI